MRECIKGVCRATLRDAETGRIIDYKEAENTVMYAGKLHVLDNIRGRTNVQNADTSNTWCAVGTGSDIITIHETGLNTEVTGSGRILVTSVSRSNQTVLFSTFFDVNEGNGTLKEAGLFVEGYDSGGTLRETSNVTGSGILFNRVVFSPITKNTTSTLTLDMEMTI